MAVIRTVSGIPMRKNAGSKTYKILRLSDRNQAKKYISIQQIKIFYNHHGRTWGEKPGLSRIVLELENPFNAFYSAKISAHGAHPVLCRLDAVLIRPGLFRINGCGKLPLPVQIFSGAAHDPIFVHGTG